MNLNQETVTSWSRLTKSGLLLLPGSLFVLILVGLFIIDSFVSDLRGGVGPMIFLSFFLLFPLIALHLFCLGEAFRIGRQMRDYRFTIFLLVITGVFGIGSLFI